MQPTGVLESSKATKNPLKDLLKYGQSMWLDYIYMDHCAMEGLSSSGNTQGVPEDALVSILKHHRVDKVLK